MSENIFEVSGPLGDSFLHCIIQVVTEIELNMVYMLQPGKMLTGQIPAYWDSHKAK